MRPSRRRLTEQGADLAARNERLLAERDAALEEASAYKTSAETSSRLYLEADEKYVDVCRELAAVRKVEGSLARQIHEMAQPVEPSDAEIDAANEVLEEHDVHRKALADALGEQKRHLNWEQLIGEVGGLAGSAAEWMADHAKEKARGDDLQQRLDTAAQDGEWRGRARRAEKRADHLQKELDNALGLPPGGPLSSAPWQPGYADPKATPKAAS